MRKEWQNKNFINSTFRQHSVDIIKKNLKTAKKLNKFSTEQHQRYRNKEFQLKHSKRNRVRLSVKITFLMFYVICLDEE